jgi:hypothetical protein
MEIRKTFANSFHDMMRAKWRWFLRRSLLRYALAIALITYGLHGTDANLTSAEVVTRGFLYFVILCVAVMMVHVVAAWMQSRRITPRTVIFTEQDVVVEYQGESVSRGWDWIISADESPSVISLLVQRSPRLELYLSRTKLDEHEYTVLHGWLASHRKLTVNGTNT